VNRAGGLAALSGGALATDEVMRRVESGVPFRRAYREVAAALKWGERFPAPAPARLLARRRSAGSLGKLGLPQAWRRFERARRWSAGELKRFHAAMDRLVGRGR
jgi:hypothetical protein